MAIRTNRKIHWPTIKRKKINPTHPVKMLIFDLFSYLKSFYDHFFHVEKLTKAQRLKTIFDKLDALYERKTCEYLTEEDSCIAAGQLFTGQGEQHELFYRFFYYFFY